MKRFIAIVSILTGCSSIVLAQNTDSVQASPGQGPAANAQRTTGGMVNPPSPTIRAVRQLQVIQEQLNLNPDQTDRVHMILLNQAISLDSLKKNPSADQHTDRKARKDIMNDADVKIYALLTEDQRSLYQQWKDKQRDKQRQQHQLKMLVDSTHVQPQQ